MANRRLRGTTLLETILAVSIAASAVVLATTFAVNGLSITTNLHAQQDFNQATRNVSREFLGDVPQATHFFFGYFNEDTGQLNTSINPAAQELTLGWTDLAGNPIWVHYSAKTSATSDKIYLLKTSNESDPATYATAILATDLAGLTFTFLDKDGKETSLVSNIKRVDMDLKLASNEVQRDTIFTGVLRATNQGAVALPPGLDFVSIENTNFTK